MSRLLDTHCHVDAYADPRQVLIDARDAGIDVVAVTDSPDAYRRLRTRLGRAPGVTVALGLHPASRAAAAPGQLGRFFRMLPTAMWIGEVGLDFQPGIGKAERYRQQAAFDALLGHDQIRSKLLTVHSRGAARETVAALATAKCRAVLHWYSGSSGTADDALAAGLWFSVNPAMTRSARGRSLIERLPRGRVLCETDGPYCRSGARPAEPADVLVVVRALADHWTTDIEVAMRTLTANAQQFAGVSPSLAESRLPQRPED